MSCPHRLISVDVEQSETGFSFSDRTAVIDWPYFSSSFGQPYGISSDGERFLSIKTADDVVAPKVIIVQNWFEELKRLVPTN